MAEITLKDKSGADGAYSNVETLSVDSAAGDGTQEVFASQRLIQNQLQTDWLQEDESAVDYLKNKPVDTRFLPEVTQEDNDKFLSVVGGRWTGVDAPAWWATTKEVDILPEQDLVLEVYRSDGTLFSGNYYSPDKVYTDLHQLKAGETYIVVLDGVEYTCTAKDITDSADEGVTISYGVSLGNEYHSDSTKEDSGEPFCFAVLDMSTESASAQVCTLWVVSDTGAESVTARVRVYQTTKVSGVSWDSLIDRPFGDTRLISPALALSASDFPYSTDFDAYMASLDPAPFAVIPGKRYRIVFDGVEYICIGQNASALIAGMTFAGNGAVFGLSGNGEPFIIGGAPGSPLYILSTVDAEATAHTVEIIQADLLASRHLEIVETVSGGTLIPETTVTVGYMQEGLFGGQLPLDEESWQRWAAAVEQELTVEYNETAYRVTPTFYDEGTIVAGNVFLGDPSAPDTGEPFVISVMWGASSDGTVMFLSLLSVNDTGSSDSSATFERTIKVNEPDRCKIKEEYLPTMLPDVSASDVGKFLRVSADGTWVAEAIPNAEEASFGCLNT